MALAATALPKRRSARELPLFPQPGQPVAVSLFSGGGGLDIGVENAGFRVLACVEIDPNCCDTLRHNQPKYMPDARIINNDVRKVDPAKLMNELGLREGELDLLCGGPPCQTFSQIGKMDGLDDERGKLIFQMVRYAKVFRPKAVVIENVKALVKAKDQNGVEGGVLKKLKSALGRLGYTVQSEVINAADYGVAQLRKRVFIVAVQPGFDFEFPTPSHGPKGRAPYRTIRTALRGLRAPSGNRETGRNNHIDITPAGDRRRISYVPEGTYLARVEAPPSIKGRLSKKDTTKFLRLARNRQANTLRCGEIFFHPLQDRYLTPREYMRLHGFPDDYALRGPIRGRSGSVRHLDQHRQVANSVPPPVAHVVAAATMKALRHASE